MTTRHCEHVKANGRFCGSPAMQGRNYCYFHMAHIGRQLRQQRYGAHGLQAPPIELPLLEDAASIQLALMQVTEALLRGTLDRKTAGLVLYSLQTASSNVRNMQRDAEADANASTAVCNQYDSFEQDYELGDEAAASLRVEEPAKEAEAEAAEKERAALQSEGEGEASGPKLSTVMRLIAEGEAQGFLHSKGVCSPRTGGEEYGPLYLTDREAEDRRVRIPLSLSETQYLQAKSSIEEYEERHNIDAAHPKGRKPVPQRAAISQKILLSPRKPVASVTIEEAWQQLEASN